jgi:glucose-1-phosphate adenylyltransferase
MHDTLAVILAGGKGSRLEPLTRDRAKPAVPFGGSYRIIDFVLSNCLNSGLRRMLMLTQYKAMSLDRHINLGWRPFFCRELGEFIDIVPPQQRIDEQWYQGTADAVYQNIYAIEKERPEYVVILAGDHIYKMNYQSMVEYHRQTGADVTIGALRVDPVEARQFGVMEVDASDRIVGFEEKVANPKRIPGDPDHCLGSMGIYVFNARFLYEQLCRDATRRDSQHDFGRNIIPSIIEKHKVYAFPFRDENHKSDAYWRDVGTLEAYFAANMDLVSIDPQLNLYDEAWPVRTHQRNLPPPKFVFGSGQGGDDGRQGLALDSMLCQGCIVSGGKVERSVLGNQVRVNSYAHVEDSILFDGVQIGRYARVRNAIIDKGVQIPPGVEIGFDAEADRARNFTVTDSGIVVIAKADGVENIAPQHMPERRPHIFGLTRRGAVR